MPSQFVKGPDEIKDYTVSFANLIPTGGSLDGTPTATPDSVNLTVDSVTQASPVVSVRLSAGVAGERYEVTVRATSAGERYERAFTIVCRDLL